MKYDWFSSSPGHWFWIKSEGQGSLAFMFMGSQSMGHHLETEQPPLDISAEKDLLRSCFWIEAQLWDPPRRHMKVWNSLWVKTETSDQLMTPGMSGILVSWREPWHTHPQHLVSCAVSHPKDRWTEATSTSSWGQGSPLPCPLCLLAHPPDN